MMGRTVGIRRTLSTSNGWGRVWGRGGGELTDKNNKRLKKQFVFAFENQSIKNSLCETPGETATPALALFCPLPSATVCLRLLP
jgi:hypothetical protein